MTTATYFNSPNRVIEAAMENSGLLEEGDTPNSEQYAKYGNKLNDIINFLGSDGKMLWTQTDQSVTLVAAQAKYSFSLVGDVVMPRPYGVIQAYFLDTSSNKTPLTPMSREEYKNLSNDTTQGALNSYYVDKQQTSLDVYVYNVPDATAATGTLHVILKQSLTNFTGITDTLNFTVESYLLLQWALANEICTGQSEKVIARCQQKYDYYLTKFEDQDLEDVPITMYPVEYNASSFR